MPHPDAPADVEPYDPLEALVLEMAPWRRALERDDSLFDRLLPTRHGNTFNNFWTPLGVAARVAHWLDEHQIDRVVDVGSGVGKLCIAAALASRASFIGLEHRPELAIIARDIADSLGLTPRVTFADSVFGEAPTPSAPCYYFFNPFGESLLQYPFDHSVDVSSSRSLRDVFAAEQLLQNAPDGTYVITYNGFGGTLPPGYQLLRSATDFPCALCLAQKR